MIPKEAWLSIQIASCRDRKCKTQKNDSTKNQNKQTYTEASISKQQKKSNNSNNAFVAFVNIWHKYVYV